MMWSEKQDVTRISPQGNLQGATPGVREMSGVAATVRRRPEGLTPREQEILQLVWAGLTNRTIAERLQISIKTAEAHRANMMKKLRVCNIAQLLKTALEEGLLATHAG
jgi:DNA-binding NarL/FixJ family response regulator